MSTVTLLKQALADTYALYLKTQNYHWNITGPHFTAWHLMLEAQYQELADAVDSIAERIRALGSTAPGSFSQFLALTTIKEGNENAPGEVMLADLLHSHEQVIAALQQVDVAADKIIDTGTENLVDDRIQAHQKTLWMLRATLTQ